MATGSIRERKGRPKPFQARIPRPDKKGQESASFTTKKEAQVWLNRKLAAIDEGAWRPPEGGRITLSDLHDGWLKGAQLAATTSAKWDTVWRVHVEPVLGRRQITKITKADVKSLIQGITSPHQGAEGLKLVRVMLNFAVDSELITANVAARIKAPRTKPVQRPILSAPDLDAVVVHLPEHFRAFVLLTAFTSLRWSEAVALRRDDIDLYARTLRIDEAAPEVRGQFVFGPTKTEGSDRVEDLSEIVIAPLAAHLLRFPPLHDQDDPQLNGLVFTGERGGPVRRHSFRNAWRRALEAAGIDYVQPGRMRHSGASIGYAATHDLKATSRRLGHTNTRMVDDIYVKLYSEAERSFADAIDSYVKTSRKAR